MPCGNIPSFTISLIPIVTISRPSASEFCRWVDLLSDAARISPVSARHRPPINRTMSFATAGIDWPFSLGGHSADGNEPEKSFLTVSSRGWESAKVETRQNGTTNPGNRQKIWQIRSKSPHRKAILLMDMLILVYRIARPFSRRNFFKIRIFVKLILNLRRIL